MDISNKNVVRSLRGALNSIFVNTKFMKIEGLVHENKKVRRQFHYVEDWNTILCVEQPSLKDNH